MNRAGCGASAAVVLLSLYCPNAAASSWSDGAGFRTMEVHPGSGGKAGFTLMNPRATGVGFTNTLQGAAYLTNLVAHNGAGVAIGDVDGDGWPDIYLCSLQGPNRLYRNLGNWRFEEMDIGVAACAEQLSTGATFADVDGDGDLDLLVNGIAAGTRLFLKDGKGNWREARDSGLSRTASATSLALADIDGDGDLDLYCTHYIDVTYLFDPTTRFSLARRGDQWEVTKVNGESTPCRGGRIALRRCRMEKCANCRRPTDYIAMTGTGILPQFNSSRVCSGTRMGKRFRRIAIGDCR